MTDNRTTELLCKLLDERGVKWRETINHANCIFTWWESPTFGTVQAVDNEDGETLFMACLNDCDFTPEQAIAATLGRPNATSNQESIVRSFLRKISPNRDWDYLGEHEHALIADLISDIAATLGEPIIRCRDCRHATISTTGVCKYCEMFVLPDTDGYGADSQVNLPLDFFCGFAERKEVER